MKIIMTKKYQEPLLCVLVGGGLALFFYIDDGPRIGFALGIALAILGIIFLIKEMPKN